MTEARFFAVFLPVWFALAVGVFAALLWVRAPYGRHALRSLGPSMSPRWGWVLMEAPSPLCMALSFATGKNSGTVLSWILLAMWLGHYLHRTLVQPFRWRGASTPMPVLIAASGALFNFVNGSTNGRWLFHLGPALDDGWMADPRFILGALGFVVGEAVNLHADEVLLNLRAPGEKGYKIPRGGLYRWVSCPNYLGEMIVWWSFALCTWSLCALAFAVWTTANLFPRALAHHRWYQARFSDYPPERRAVLPGLV